MQARDLSGPEMMPAAQATAWKAMFTQVAYKAAHLTTVDQVDRLTRLALKAQSHCRARVETLAVIKNPSVFCPPGQRRERAAAVSTTR